MAGHRDPEITTTKVSKEPTMPVPKIPLAPWYACAVANITTETAAAPHNPNTGCKAQMRYPRKINSSQKPADNDSATHQPISDRVRGESFAACGFAILIRLGRLFREIRTMVLV
jgi:hypothetical protein